MAEAGKIVLHTFSHSSCAWRVRLALAYKGIPYEYKAYNVFKGEHLTEEYKKVSPLQLVPALEIDGAVLNESLAIFEYLEERFPDKKPLLPKDLKTRAAIRGVADILTSSIQPLSNKRVLDAVVELAGEDARQKWGYKWITKGFAALEQILEKTSGKYCFGDEFTMADCFLFPQAYSTGRFQVDLAMFPTLARITKNLYELEFVANSTPDRQPDFC